MTDPSSSTTSTADGVEKSSPPVKKTWARTIREWIVSLAIVAAILLPIRSSIADWNDVPTGSMRPTILEGERIYVNLLAYGLRVPFTRTWVARWGSPQRGEVVTLRSPEPGNIRLVKRVIGVPGDTIMLRDHVLYLNGQAVSATPLGTSDITFMDKQGPIQTQLFREDLPVDARAGAGNGGSGGAGRSHTIAVGRGVNPGSGTMAEKTIPAGHYFMMGDNRCLSRDSRTYGFVPENNILGRSPIVVFSVDKRNWYLPRFSRWFKTLQ
jgi:signal peptidase I